MTAIVVITEPPHLASLLQANLSKYRLAGSG